MPHVRRARHTPKCLMQPPGPSTEARSGHFARHLLPMHPAACTALASAVHQMPIIQQSCSSPPSQDGPKPPVPVRQKKKKRMERIHLSRQWNEGRTEKEAACTSAISPSETVQARLWVRTAPHLLPGQLRLHNCGHTPSQSTLVIITLNYILRLSMPNSVPELQSH